jgi:hypothetical protein
LSVRKQQPVGDEDPTDNEGYPNQIIGVESDPNPPIIAVSIQLLVHAQDYVWLPSFSAHAAATAEFDVSLPGTMAQPPFSMSDRRSQDEIFLNSASFSAAPAWCWNFSTQIGVSAATIAVSVR